MPAGAKRRRESIMRDITRMFVVSRTQMGWSNGEKYPATTFLIVVKGNKISLVVREGKPDGDDVIAAIRLLVATAAIARPQRKVPFRFLIEYTDEGTEITFVEEEEFDGYPSKKPLTSVDMSGVIEFEPGVSVYDILDLLVADRRLLVRNGEYTVEDGAHFEDEFSAITMVEPRDTSSEPGWFQPSEIPHLTTANSQDEDDDWEE